MWLSVGIWSTNCLFYVVKTENDVETRLVFVLVSRNRYLLLTMHMESGVFLSPFKNIVARLRVTHTAV